MPIDVKKNKEEYLFRIRENIKRDGIEDLLAWLETTDFFTAPASTKYHLSEEGGTCLHHLNVHDALLKRLDPEGKLKAKWKETLAIVALMHDYNKADMYKKDFRNVKDEFGKWVQEPYYKVEEAFPFGHSEKSIFLIMEHMMLTRTEAGAIRGHMGAWDASPDVVGNIFNSNTLAVHLHIADMEATYLMEANQSEKNEKPNNI